MYASDNSNPWIYVRTGDINWLTPHPRGNLEMTVIRFLVYYSFKLLLMEEKTTHIW